VPLTPDQLDPDWHKYPDTVLHFRTDPVVRVDLRQPVGKDELAAIKRVGLTGAFAVLTAHDPRGRDEATEANQLRAAKLQERLASLHARVVEVDACSPDRSHCEESVAVAIEQESAVRLAREFEQVAIFWFDGERFWIVGAMAGVDLVMLPRPV